MIHAEGNTGFTAEIINNAAEQIAGGDIYNNYEQNTIENPNGFTEINTGAYRAEHFTSPVFTADLAAQLITNKLLIIAGGSGFDKSSFARHLATTVAGDRTVVEWRDAENGRSPADEIRETETPSVFILNQVLPQVINYDISHFVSLAGIKHLFILTTELTAETWQLPAGILLRFWFDIPVKNIYSIEQVCNAFIRRFKQDNPGNCVQFRKRTSDQYVLCISAIGSATD
jgi:hypothetical protein